MPKIGQVRQSHLFWQTTDQQTVKLYCGNVIDVLKELPAESVQCVVTSPPYWGLRAYKTNPQVWGGEPTCQHTWQGSSRHIGCKQGKTGQRADRTFTLDEELSYNECSLCGAWRGELGSEPTPEMFVGHLTDIFREVRRVLRNDGVLFLNLGDTYSGSSSSGGKASFHATAKGKSGLPAGNLVGIPWRVAFALQADGWILRQEIIWHKPNPMPESVKNRCTKSHEHVFLFAKNSGYFWNAEAIREEGMGYGYGEGPAAFRLKRYLNNNSVNNDAIPDETSGTHSHSFEGGRNKRSVWTIASGGYPGAHFATFPKELVRPCILAGTSEYGCCADCGAPYERILETTKIKRERPNDYVKRTGEEGTGNSCSNSVAGIQTKTLGWQPTCECHGHFEKRKGVRLGYGSYHDHKNDGVQYGLYQEGMTFKGALSKGYSRPLKEFRETVIEYVPDIPLDDHPVIACTVLDPFIGSGTTCLVALEEDRYSIGIDLQEDYLEKHAKSRIEGELLGRPAVAYLAGTDTAKLITGGVECQE